MEAKTTFEGLHWRFTKGKSITKQIYVQLIGEDTRVPWKDMIFNNAARPKAKFTLCLQLQSRLLTTDKLVKWGLVMDTQCVMCRNAEETHEHLFWECILAKEVWHIVNQWAQGKPMSAIDWQHHQQEIIKRAKRKNQTAQIFKMIYTEFVHSIWIERNMRIFEKIGE
ncbi:uncharacterized protein [Nicotiana sylvestris]|uniref:uncharacterized protein n=1 Tax=Nicotiana sylvestris TaxID=4096 RepID=UPI00388C9A57